MHLELNLDRPKVGMLLSQIKHDILMELENLYDIPIFLRMNGKQDVKGLCWKGSCIVRYKSLVERLVLWLKLEWLSNGIK